MSDRRETNPTGLLCPRCECPESEVVWVRNRTLTIDGKRVGRRVRKRRCLNERCGHQFVTSERIAGAP